MTTRRKLYEGNGNQCPDLDAALDQLMARARYGVPMTFDEMAQHCPCSRQNLRMYAERALKKLRRSAVSHLTELMP